MDKTEDKKYRRLNRPMNIVTATLAVGFTLYHIAYLSGMLSYFHIFIDTPIHLAVHLAFVMPLTFILLPLGKAADTQKKIPVYDFILLGLAAGWNLYIIVNYEMLYMRSITGYLLVSETIFCWVNLLLLLEAARRLLGWTIPLIVMFFVVYALFSNYFPGFLYAKGHSWDRVGHYVGLFVSGIYGNILNISATIVVSFILFSQFLFVTGAGEWFIKIAQAVLGHVRGGPAKVAIMCSALMGTLAGSGMANVATTGVFTIPLMKSTGYKSHFAAGVESAASNGGQIMPPVMGIAAFIMVDFLGMPYSKIVVAAIIPALAYFLALFLMVDLEAVRLGLKGLPKAELPRLGPTIREGWQFIIPLVVLMFLLVGLQYSPAYSALIATGVQVVIGVLNKNNRVTPRKVYLALKNTAVVMLMMAIILALAGIIVGCVQLTGLSYRLSMGLSNLAGDNVWLLLLLTAITGIILGMGMTTSAVYIMMAVLVAPALIEVGISPIAAHFFVFYYGVAALVTPPVCPTSYVAAVIANAKPMKTGLAGAQLAVVGFIIPFVFVFRPALLMEGSAYQVVFASVVAIVITVGLSFGLAGYYMGGLHRVTRFCLAAFSLLMIYPSDAFALTGMIVILGYISLKFAYIRFRNIKPIET